MVKYLKSNFNYYAYCFFKRYYFQIVKNKTALERLTYIEQLSLFAWKNFPLLLSDIQLENEISSISKDNLFPKWKNKLKTNTTERQNVLHIATEIYNVGGHTRVIKNWITNDKKRNTFFILTNQKAEPEILNEISLSTVETKIIDKDLDYLKKSNLILEFIQKNNIQLVVFHTHPHDVIPVLISSIVQFPYTILFNHADHCFGLGASTSNLYLDLSKKGSQQSLEYRGVSESKVINLPINSFPDLKYKSPNKDKIVFVTMASSIKFKPFEDLNFFKTFVPFLNKHKNVVLKIIGLNSNEYKRFTRLEKPKNLELLGIVKKPKEILKNADYFIEMFPISSYLSALDSISYGLMPIFNYNQILTNNAGTKDLFPFFENRSFYETEKEYLNFLTKEITTNSFKKENLEKVTLFLQDKCYKNWYRDLNNIISNLPEKYKSRKIKSLKLKNTRAKKYARFTFENNVYYWSDLVSIKKMKTRPFLYFNFVFLFFLEKFLKKIF